jgi:hypothetical protein
VDALEHPDHRLLHGVVTVVERDRGADPPHIRAQGAQQRGEGQRLAALGGTDHILKVHAWKKPGTS